MNTQRFLTGTIIAVFVFLLGALLFILYDNGYLSFKNFNLARITGSKVIAKVGNENIYQADLDYELSVHPQKDDPQTKQILLDKMVKDSIVLQAAQADGKLQLDSTIYNSPNKDYAKRIEAIRTFKESLNVNAKGIEGSVIAIWFRNDFIGSMGLEKAKQIAFEKISSLQKQVKSKTMTIQEAGDAIKNDTSLAEIDPAYYSNAIYSFKSDGSERITLNEDLDKALLQMNAGETSDVYLTKTKDLKTGEVVESHYYFAQVTRRIDTPQALDFEKWFESRKSAYETIYY